MILTVLYLKTILFTFLILCNVLGYFLSIKKFFGFQSQNIFTIFIQGSSLLIFFSYLINFFSPLNIYITNIFFIFFSIMGLIFLIIYKNINYRYMIIIVLIASLITFLSKPYNDYELYHLPYMEILRKFKIIFGLSNFDFRYGHTSVFQNISAFQYNSLMLKDSYVFYTPLLTILSAGYLYQKLIKTKNNFISLISLSTLIYYLLHGTRYGSLGNDLPTHILAVISIILFIEIKNNNSFKKENIFLFLTIILVITLSKFSLILFSLLPVYLVIKRKIFLDLKNIFLLILLSFFLIKNFINTSCLVYPISFLCFETKWSVNEYSYTSPKTISMESSAMVKTYMESKYLNDPNLKKNFIDNLLELDSSKKILSHLPKHEKSEYINFQYYKYYSQFKIWFPEYLKGNDFFKLLKNIFFLCFIIFLIFYFYLKSQILDNFNLLKLLTKFLVNNYFITFFLLINFLVWLINFPQVRYGLSYVLILCMMPSIVVYGNCNLQKVEKIFKILIILSFSYAILSNSLRILKESKKYTKISDILHSQIVPLSKFDYKTIKTSYNFDIRQPIGGVCTDIEQLCSVFTDRFLITQRKIHKSANNYIIIK